MPVSSAKSKMCANVELVDEMCIDSVLVKCFCAIDLYS